VIVELTRIEYEASTGKMSFYECCFERKYVVFISYRPTSLD